jgi:hypothetical protein
VIRNGCVHPALVIEPNGSGDGHAAGEDDAPIALPELAA